MSDPKDPENQKVLHYIMAKHAPLVRQEISRLRSNNEIPDHIPDSELTIHGLHGVLEAFHNWDPEVASRTAKDSDTNHFAKYASWRIQGKIKDHLASQDVVPKSIRKQVRNLGKMDQEE